MGKIVNLIEFRDGNKQAKDDRTQKWLLDKINIIVHRVNTTNDSDENIAEFIKKSFAINGMIDTYNQLGYKGWYDMILQMAEHEVYERNKGYAVRIRN